MQEGTVVSPSLKASTTRSGVVSVVVVAPNRGCCQGQDWYDATVALNAHHLGGNFISDNNRVLTAAEIRDCWVGLGLFVGFFVGFFVVDLQMGKVPTR